MIVGRNAARVREIIPQQLTAPRFNEFMWEGTRLN